MNERSPGTPPVDVVALMDGARFRGLPCLVSVLTVLAMVFDGFDIQAIAFAAPKLLDEFQVSRVQLSPILAAGLIGMAVGAFSFGPIGDRLGRRFALTASLLIVASMSLGASFAQGPDELAAWRFATGVGLGGVVPNCTALMVEFAPLAVRNVLVALTLVGVPIGGVLGAELAAQIMPIFGWRAIFVIGAVLPAALAFVIFLTLPESPRYLARAGNRGDELARLLNRISGRGDFRSDMQFVVMEPGHVPRRAAIAALFSREFRRDTIVIWLIFITNIFAVYAFFSWLPTVLSSAGLSLSVALRGALFFNLGGVLAAVIAATCISRFGSRPTLAVVGLGAIVATAAIGFIDVDVDTGVGLLLVVMSLSGACILSTQVCMYAVAANAYPTAIRATGVGWASGIARFGGILSSFAGGALLSLGDGMRPFFVAIAAVLVLTLVGVLNLNRHMQPSR